MPGVSLTLDLGGEFKVDVLNLVRQVPARLDSKLQYGSIHNYNLLHRGPAAWLLQHLYIVSRLSVELVSSAGRSSGEPIVNLRMAPAFEIQSK